MQAPTIAGLIQLACLVSHDSLHLRTHLQLSASVLLAAVPLNMWRDRICLLTHDVQAIVIIDLPFSYPTKDTPLMCISYATKNANTHRSSLSTRHSAVTIGILPTMAGRCEHTTVCTLEPFYKEHVIEMSHHEIAQHVVIILMANIVSEAILQ